MMSDEEVKTLDGEEEKKPAAKERRRAPGAFAAFESKFHVVGNVLVLLVCIALIAACAFSNATFGIYTLPDGTQAEVSQNMIQMGSAFTAFAMDDQELVDYKTAADKLISDEVAASGADLTDSAAAREALETAMANHTEINYAKYVLVSALINLKYTTGSLQASYTPSGGQDSAGEETTVVDTIQVYVTFGLTVLGVGAVLPMGLAVLSLAILVLKGLFILIFCRNGKSLHIAFPLVCMFTILALLMLQLGAVGEPGMFLYVH